MAVIATDDFNRANENPLSDGGNWTKVTDADAAMRVVSNSAQGGTSSTSWGDASLWTGDSFDDDQWIEVDATYSSVGDAELLIRANVAGTQGYLFAWDGDACTIYELPGFSALGTATGNPTSGTHTMRFEAVGNTITGFIDGVEVISVTDSTWSSGAPGLLSYRSTGGAGYTFDNFSAGDFTVSSIYDNFRQIADGNTLASSADWTTHQINLTGVPTSDQHTDHASGQVLDMSNTGQTDAMYVSDTLDSDDQYAEVLWFPDSYEDASIDNSSVALLLRSNQNDPDGFDGYEFEATAYRYDTSPNLREIFCSLFSVTGGVRTQIGAASGVVRDGAVTYGMHRLSASIVGSTLTVSIDGIEAISLTDTTHSTGRYVGLHMSRIVAATESQPLISEFKAWTPNDTSAVYGGGKIVSTTVDQTWNALTATDSVGVDVAPTAGNMLLLAAGSGGAPTIVSVTDDGTGGWTQQFVEAAGVRGLYVYTKEAAGDETIVTVTWDQNEQSSVHIVELDGTWTVDATATSDTVSPVTGTLSADPKIGFCISEQASHPIPALAGYRPIAYNYSNEVSPTPDTLSLWAWDLGTDTTAFDPDLQALGTQAVGVIVFKQGAVAPPPAAQTLTGTAASINVTATSGSFTPGAVTLTGTAASIAATAASGSFRSVLWSNSVVTTTDPGASPQTLTGTAVTVQATAPSGSFTAGGAAIVGSPAGVSFVATTGAFAPGTATLAGTAPTVSATTTSGSLIPGAVALAGGDVNVAVVSSGGALIPGAVALTGTSAALVVTAAPGAISALGGPQSLVGGDVNVAVVSSGGALIPGAVALVGSVVTVTATAAGGAIAAGGAPQSLTGADINVSIVTLPGVFTAGAGPPLSGTPILLSLSATAGTITPGLAAVTGTPITVEVTPVSGAFVAQDSPQTMVGTAVAVQVTPAPGSLRGSAQATVGTPLNVAVTAASGAITASGITLTGTAARVTVTLSEGSFSSGGSTLSGTGLVLAVSATGGSIVPGPAAAVGAPIVLAATPAPGAIVGDGVLMVGAPVIVTATAIPGVAVGGSAAMAGTPLFLTATPAPGLAYQTTTGFFYMADGAALYVGATPVLYVYWGTTMVWENRRL